MAPDIFGHLPDGRPVERVRLHGGALTAAVLTWGATVQDLRLTGVGHPLVLGAERPEPYLGPLAHAGAIVGRYANRIGGARFVLDGRTVHLSRNQQGRHCLHGGEGGTSRRLWTLADRDRASVTLTLSLPDGDMGFPGRLDLTATLTLDDRALDIAIRATCDRATPCSLSHHGYFALDDTGTLDHHHLRVQADHWLPLDADLVPTGRIAPVAGTGDDFRHLRPLAGLDLDRNFCLSAARAPLRPVAWLTSTASGLTMQVETTEPGLQVHTAGHLPKPGAPGVPGLGGRRYGRHAGVALEAQHWPDAPNHPQFPPAILRPGMTDLHHTRYIFHGPG